MNTVAYKQPVATGISAAILRNTLPRNRISISRLRPHDAAFVRDVIRFVSCSQHFYAVQDGTADDRVLMLFPRWLDSRLDEATGERFYFRANRLPDALDHLDSAAQESESVDPFADESPDPVTVEQLITNAERSA